MSRTFGGPLAGTGVRLVYVPGSSLGIGALGGGAVAMECSSKFFTV